MNANFHQPFSMLSTRKGPWKVLSRTVSLFIYLNTNNLFDHKPADNRINMVISRAYLINSVCQSLTMATAVFEAYVNFDNICDH